MMVKVRKAFGENPEKVHVLDTFVEFDAQGEAEVNEEVAEVFGQIPGYELIEENAVAPSEDYEVVQDDITSIDESTSEEDEEEEEVEEAPKTPKRPARKTPAKK